MPDPLEPNDLSHLSDEEFNALCPIGHHALGPEPLSPAAQAVLDAAIEAAFSPDAEAIAAAAPRAAALQIEDAHDGLGCLEILRLIAAELEVRHG